MISAQKLKSMIKILNKKEIKIYPTSYTLFIPRFRFLEKIFFLEKYLEKFPIGCQYYITIEKIGNFTENTKIKAE